MDNKSITVKKILEICKGELILGNENQEINSYSKDSREIRKGDMYLAIRGEKYNGNDYIESAFKNEAVGCITDGIVESRIIDRFNTLNSMQNETKRTLK